VDGAAAGTGGKAMRRRSAVGAATLAVVLTLAISGTSSAATVVNGGFETGTFSGWTVVDQEGSFFGGQWFVYSGTATPFNFFPIPAPPEGTFAATTDQGGPGSHVLYQDVALEAGFRHVLSFDVYYNNQNGAFATPDTLDFNVFPNQQYRIDVLRAGADPFSVAAGDVLATVFRTQVGDPPTLAPTRVTFDLSAFAGTTVRLRFAEVDNQLFFNASVDNVVIESVRLLPTSKDQCKKGGWRSFGSVFKNQGDCVSFVATRGRNTPAGGGGGSSATAGAKAAGSYGKARPPR
jgi:hypothetical protein